MTNKQPQRIYRYEVPVDEEWHKITLTGPILHVASRESDIVEFWSWTNDHPPISYMFKAFGTGWPVPEIVSSIQYVGTALATNGFVWHLFRELANEK
jgi:hypothetical protein